MSRRIDCRPCGAKWKPHPQDCFEGWQHRAVHLSAKKPDDHGVTVKTDDKSVTEQLPSIVCDLCGEAIPDGSIVLAVTMWRGDFDIIVAWEHEYGTVLSEDAAKLVGVLEKGAK